MKKRFVYFIFRKKDINKIKVDFKKFGLDKKIDYIDFILIRTVISMLSILIFSMYFKLYMSCILSIIVYLLFGFYIKYKLKKRGLVLEGESLYFFEILTLSLENNNTFEKALEITCNSINSNISKEFYQIIHKIKLGKTIVEALDEMKLEIPSENINIILTNIIENIESGSNMIEMMNNQCDFLNDKYILSIKEKINKIPTQVSIYSVLIFLPLMFLLILTPVILEYIING